MAVESYRQGRPIRWEDGEGRGAGIADDGALLVETSDGPTRLSAGEVLAEELSHVAIRDRTEPELRRLDDVTE